MLERPSNPCATHTLLTLSTRDAYIDPPIPRFLFANEESVLVRENNSTNKELEMELGVQTEMSRKQTHHQEPASSTEKRKGYKQAKECILNH